ncbi:hypothetical protein [Phaeovulum sp.]|uniref:hypothetical protein n=1 Tax=Phaeovulum sp. TaxID=2934796 RepID=UPI0039E520C7
MQVVFHLGAHASDEDRLVKTLLRNRATLNGSGLVVPPPKRYRMLLRDTLLELRGAPADSAKQQEVLAAVSDINPPDRIFFSHEFFTCIPQRVITEAGFYTMAQAKLKPLANLFPEAEIEFHFALVNPATLVPALIQRIEGASYESVMVGNDPRALRWLPVIRQMAEVSKSHKLVLWCHEDTPLIWPEILRHITHLPQEAAFEGDFAILATIMSPEGLDRLRAYLSEHSPKTIAHRRKIVAVFLEKFGLRDKIEIEVPLPGWTDDLVTEITANYDADVAEIATMDGVEFIAP